MIINTTRFGELEIADDFIFSFPFGLPGFPTEKSFVLLPHQQESPFAFLQSSTTPQLSFLLVDPFIAFQGYQVELREGQTQDLQCSEENKPAIYAIVTVPEDIRNMTANLLAPIVLNLKNRVGAQIVLEKANYTTRHRVFPETSALQNPKEGEKVAGEGR